VRHPPTPVPQVWWFTSDIARSIKLFTCLLVFVCYEGGVDFAGMLVT